MIVYHRVGEFLGVQNIGFFVDYESWNFPLHIFLTTMQYVTWSTQLSMVCVWKYTQGIKNHGIKTQCGSDMV